MRRTAWFITYVLLTACVDPISFTTPDTQPQVVIDGMITDEPGPYTVTLSFTRNLDIDALSDSPLEGAQVTIRSDAGETEDLVPTGQPGVYQTTSIQGVVGRSYSILIRVRNKVYESLPEKLPAAGQIDAINRKFQQLSAGKNSATGQFNISVDGRAASVGENYLRWRIIGTYKVENFPQYNTTFEDGVKVPDPFPCSGYLPKSKIKAGPCTCCICWVTQYGTPQLTDTKFTDDGTFRGIQVGTVPVNRRTFYDKYYVEVEQLSLTQNAYNFWKLLQAQREGGSSLFQPPLAQVKGNIFNQADDKETVQGYFTAAGVRKKSLFLSVTDIPIVLAPIDTLTINCIGGNSSAIKPVFWK